MRLFSVSAVENLINRYLDKGGEITTVKVGVLGYGTTLLAGEGLKTAIIKEVFINEWSSGHTVRFYSKTPKKYSKFLETVC